MKKEIRKELLKLMNEYYKDSAIVGFDFLGFFEWLSKKELNN